MVDRFQEGRLEVAVQGANDGVREKNPRHRDQAATRGGSLHERQDVQLGLLQARQRRKDVDGVRREAGVLPEGSEGRSERGGCGARFVDAPGGRFGGQPGQPEPGVPGRFPVPSDENYQVSFSLFF